MNVVLQKSVKILKKIHHQMRRRMTKRIISVSGWILLSLLLIILTIHLATGILINELMYNPNGSDTGREWIEIDLNSSCINLSAYTLYESATQHRIELFNASCSPQTCSNNCTYAILCDTCSNFVKEYAAIATTVPIFQTSFSLSNTGEVISLRQNSSIIDEINYSSITTAIREGHSIIRRDKNSWIAGQEAGTPGRGEVTPNEATNSTEYNATYHDSDILNATNTTMPEGNGSDHISTTDTNTTLITNMTDNSSTMNATSDTITNTSYVNSTVNCTPMNTTLRVQLKDNKTIYEEGDTIRFSNIIEGDEEDITIEYWVEDLFGNIYKNRVQTTNQNEKSYTPKCSENDHILLIKSRLIAGPGNSSDIICDSPMRHAEQYILIKRKVYSEPSDATCPKCVCTKESSVCPKTEAVLATTYDVTSHIELRDITEDQTQHRIRATIDLYRGDSRKSVVNIRIIDAKNRSISSPVKITLEKYSSVLMDFPVSIACKSKESSLIVEGLDIMRTVPLTVCEDQVAEENTSTSTLAGEARTNNVPANTSPFATTKNNKTIKTAADTSIPMTGNTIYASTNQKNKMYAVTGIVLLLCIGAGYGVTRWLRKPDRCPKMPKR